MGFVFWEVRTNATFGRHFWGQFFAVVRGRSREFLHRYTVRSLDFVPCKV